MVVMQTKENLKKKYELHKSNNKQSLYEKRKPRVAPISLETNYSNFKPSSFIPLVHSVQKVHPPLLS
jgi:hypothetical protein